MGLVHGVISDAMTGIPLALAVFGVFALLWVFNRAWIARPFTNWLESPRWGQTAGHWVGLAALAAILVTGAIRLWIMVR